MIPGGEVRGTVQAIPFRLTPRSLFLGIGAVGSLAMMILTPPFQVADEPAHFLRAFQVAEGRVLPELSGDQAGGMLPASLRDFIHSVGSGVAHHPRKKVDVATLDAARGIRLVPENRVFLDFRNSSQLTFVPYLPQAAGIALVRALDDRPIVLLYAARLSNLVVASLLIAWGCSRLTESGWVIALVALTPIGLQLRGSSSADALTTGLGLALAAMVLAALVDMSQLAWRARTEIILLCALLTLSKPVYAPLAFAVVAVPSARFATRRSRVLFLAAVAMAGVLSTWVALSASLRVQTPFRADLQADRAARIEQIVDQPATFMLKAGRAYVATASAIARQTMGGNLGWLDTRIPVLVPWALMALLLVASVVDSPPDRGLRPLQRGALLLTSLASLLALAAAQYVNWTPEGALRVQGIQGRYLHPIVPFLLATVSSARISARCRRRCPGVLPWVIAIGASGAAVVALVAISRRYY